MQCLGSQTLSAGGSSPKLHLQVTCKGGKRILPAATEEKTPRFFKKYPLEGIQPMKPFVDHKRGNKDDFSLPAGHLYAGGGKKHGHFLLCC